MFFGAAEADLLLDTVVEMRGSAAAPTKDDVIKALEAVRSIRTLIAHGILPLRLPDSDRPGVCLDYDGRLAGDEALGDQARLYGDWLFIRKK